MHINSKDLLLVAFHPQGKNRTNEEQHTIKEQSNEMPDDSHP